MGVEVCPRKCARRGMPYCASFAPPPPITPWVPLLPLSPPLGLIKSRYSCSSPALLLYHHHQCSITQPVPRAQGAAAVAEGGRRGGAGGRRQPGAAAGLARGAARAHLLHPHRTIGRAGRAYAYRLGFSVNWRRSAGLAHGRARAHPQHPCTLLGPPHGAERAALQHIKIYSQTLGPASQESQEHSEPEVETGLCSDCS